MGRALSNPRETRLGVARRPVSCYSTSMFYVLLVIILFAGEIYLSIQIGEAIGALKTILIMVGITLLGLFWIKLEAYALARKLESEFKTNTSMTDTGVELVFIIAGAVLFILPGFIEEIIRRSATGQQQPQREPNQC